MTLLRAPMSGTRGTTVTSTGGEHADRGPDKRGDGDQLELLFDAPLRRSDRPATGPAGSTRPGGTPGIAAQRRCSGLAEAIWYWDTTRRPRVITAGTLAGGRCGRSPSHHPGWRRSGLGRGRGDLGGLQRRVQVVSD